MKYGLILHRIQFKTTQFYCMQTDEKNLQQGVTGQGNDITNTQQAEMDAKVNATEKSKKDHHNSAIYATSHLHSAVHHVKPKHSTHIDL